jgi:antibiotic biosynthesis monooxygenase (ABM) superfamily enzyme
MYPPVRQLQPLRRRFEPKPTRSPAPQRHKLAFLTWVGAYPVITVILVVLGPAMATWPLALRTLVVSVLMVGVLSWLVMPGLTRLLRPWLTRA